MAIKTNEIYSSLWASCDKLRGGMDASQYKSEIICSPICCPEMKKALSASGADGTRAGCAKTDVSPTQIF